MEEALNSNISIKCQKDDSDPCLSPEKGSLFHKFNQAKVKEKIKSNRQDSNDGCSRRPTRKKTIAQNNRMDLQYRNDFKLFDENDPPYEHPTYRFDKYPSLDVLDHVKAQELCDKLCTKIFKLKDDKSCESSSFMEDLDSTSLFSSLPWEIAELQELKLELNKVKYQLESIDLEKWHKHTHIHNPAYKISPTIRNKAQPELLTQAFLKFYEILHAFPVIQPNDELTDLHLNTVHLCEAPGAFIVALNHYLGLHRKDVKWNWLGNTLNPHHEGIPSSECISDDRLILHTLPNWFFGTDHTGNITDKDYIFQLRKYAKKLFQKINPNYKCDVDFNKGLPINLVTADGSIDCHEFPSEQESATHALHLSEVLTALSLLCNGGSFVFKLFTFFECNSINLLFLIYNSFQRVYLYKPTTSKLGNSEVYVIGLKFVYNYWHKMLCDLLLVGLSVERNKDVALFSKDIIPPSFLTTIIECAKFFTNHQIDAIKSNMETFKLNTKRSEQYSDLVKNNILRRFMYYNACIPIKPERNIVKWDLRWDNVIIPDTSSLRWVEQIFNKTKLDRIKFIIVQFNSLVKFFYDKNKDFKETRSFSSRDHSQNELAIKKGNSFYRLYISRFCHTNVILVYNYFFNVINADFYKQICEMRRLEEDEVSQLEQSLCADADDDIQFVNGTSSLMFEGCTDSIEEVFSLINSGSLKQSSKIIITNCLLLSRLQYGLFILLVNIFEEINFFIPLDHLKRPYIVLNKPDILKGRTIYESLLEAGFVMGGSASGIHEIFPIDFLVFNDLYPYVCAFNASICLHNIEIFKNYISNLIKS